MESSCLPDDWLKYLLWLVDINQGTNFGSCEWNVLISNNDLQFLWWSGEHGDKFNYALFINLELIYYSDEVKI